MKNMQKNRVELIRVLTAALSIGVDVDVVFVFGVGVVAAFFGVPLQNETSQWVFFFKVL
jgi:hypothetical protein